MSGEARFGITIEGKDAVSPAILSAAAAEQQLATATDRLTHSTAAQTAAANAAAAANQKNSGAASAAGVSAKGFAQAQDVLKRATQESTTAIAAQGGAFGQLTSSMANVLGAGGALAVGIAGVGAAVLAASNRVADYQERMMQMAATTGLTVEELAGLKVNAAEAGKSFDSMMPAVNIFIRKIGEAADGNSKISETFEELGVSVLNSSGEIRESGAILRDVQKALNDIESPAERARIAIQLFGRGGLASMPVLLASLDQGIEKATALGVALDEEAKAKALAADEAFDRMSVTLEGLANTAGVFAATLSNPVVEAIGDVLTAIAEFVNSPEVKAWERITGGNKSRADKMADLREQAAKRGYVLDDKGNVINDKLRPPGPLTGDTFSDMSATRPWDLSFDAKYHNRFEGFDNTKQMSPIPDEAEKAFDDLAASAKQAAIEQEKWAAQMKEFQALNRNYSGERGPGSWATDAGGNRFMKYAPGGFQFAGGAYGPMPGPDIDRFAQQPPYFPMLNATGLTGGGTAGIGDNKDLKEAVNRNKEMLKSMVGSLVSSFSSFITDALMGIRSLKDAFSSLARSVVSMVVQGGITAALRSAGFPLQSGGQILRAQTGMVLEGMRGVDSALALIGNHEMIVDHQTSDGLKLLVPKLDEYISRSGGQTQQIVFGNGAFQITIQSGLDDPLAIRAIVNDKLMPEISRAIRYGTFKRAA